MNNSLSRFILTFSLFLSAYCVSGQTYLFQETFDEANGSNTGVDNSGNNIGWNSTCPFANDAQDYFNVRNGKLEGRDTNGEAIFTTNPIDISSALQGVILRATFSESGDMEDCTPGCEFTCLDWVRFEWRVDGGPWTLHPSSIACTNPSAGSSYILLGNMSQAQETFTSGCITGDSLEIRIAVANWAADEYWRIDDIEVFTEQTTGQDSTINTCDTVPFDLFFALGSNPFPTTSGVWSGPSPLTGGFIGTFTPGVNVSGVYTYSLPSNLCPTSTDITVNSITSIEDSSTLTACDSIQVGGIWYSSDTTLVDSFVTAAGCDSVVTVEVLIQSTLFGNDTINGCDSILFDGQYYYSDTVVYDSIPVGAGCDSVVAVALVFGGSSAPTAICQGAPLYLNSSGFGVLDASLVNNGSFDDCSIDTLLLDRDTFYCNDVGLSPITVNLTVFDGGGSSSTCSALVSVIDTITPTALCRDTTIYVDSFGQVTLTANELDAGSFSNCLPLTTSLSQTNFNCAISNSDIVTLTVIDANGNQSTCNSTVTLVDTIAPVLICENVTLFLDGSGNVSTTASTYAPFALDNCNGAAINLTASQTQFTCNDLSQILPLPPATILWINEFHYDNTGSDQGEFIEIAGTANTDLTGYSLVLYNGSNGTVYNSQVLSGSLSDDGNGFGFFVVNYPSNGIQNGPDAIALIDPMGMPVEFFAYEGSFTATDGPLLGITFPDFGLEEPGSTPVGFSLQRYGIGSQSFDFSQDTIASSTPGAANLGQVFLNYTLVPTQVNVNASDSAGNLSTCTVNVSVIDAIAPIIECANDTAVDNELGLCGATVTYPPLNFTDNCGATIAQVGGLGSGAFFPVGNTVETYVATDSFGNTDTCSFTITVNETSQIIDSFSFAGCDSVEVNGVFYTSSTVFTEDFTTVNGCDSIEVYIVDVYPSYNQVNNIAGCGGVNYEGTTYLADTTFIQSFQTAFGCDSIITTVIDVVEAYEVNLAPVSACPPFTWQGQVITQSGVYTDTLQSTEGCDSVIRLTVNITANPVVTIAIDSGISCNGDSDGELSAVVSGGTAPYVADWSIDGTGDFDDGIIQVNVGEGSYTVQIQDAEGCLSNTASIVLEEPEAMTVFATAYPELEGSSIDITILGGSPPFSFDWNNDGIGDNDDPEDLVLASPNTYSVIVTDANGCNAFFSDSIVLGGYPTSIIHVDGLEVSLFPNPTNGLVNVVYQPLNNEDMLLEILDIQGRLIQSKRLTQEGMVQFDLSHLPDGTYLARFSQQDLIKDITIIKAE